MRSGVRKSTWEFSAAIPQIFRLKKEFKLNCRASKLFPKPLLKGHHHNCPIQLKSFHMKTKGHINSHPSSRWSGGCEWSFLILVMPSIWILPYKGQECCLSRYGSTSGEALTLKQHPQDKDLKTLLLQALQQEVERQLCLPEQTLLLFIHWATWSSWSRVASSVLVSSVCKMELLFSPRGC